jgi:hypothetical protein
LVRGLLKAASCVNAYESDSTAPCWGRAYAYMLSDRCSATDQDALRLDRQEKATTGALLQENGKPGAERHSVTEAEKQTGVRVTNWRMVQHRRMEQPVLRTEKI